MTKENIMRFRRIYKIILSASIIIAGILLIIGCISIYFSGKGYSRNIVVQIFSKISIPVCISLVLIIADIIWELISPSTVSKANIKKSNNINDCQPTKHINPTKFIFLGVAIIVLILGAVLGGYADVLTKAINICTECIGLG